MCGINGIYQLSKLQSPQEEIDRMNQRSRHRGPDHTGVYLDEYIALGHNRLSIIDLNEGAHQPFSDQDSDCVIVFNGEIYNYKEIKEKLPDYSFKTSSDTEVVLAAYLKWGVECIHQFNGMFAFAIWDKNKRQLFVARDRIGIKPLYYFDNNTNLVFSSEIRSLLECSLVDRKMDPEALVDYLRYSTVHAPNTMIKNVKVLEPGTYMIVSEDQYTFKKYWDVNQRYTKIAEQQSYDEVKEEVKRRLLDSVKRRLVADVPFGAFLSGGIDSSAVVALMSQVSDQPVKTFNISFAEEEFSEAKYARKIAEKYNTDHTEIKLKPEDFLKELPVALEAMDHPSGDGPNSYIVSEVTKNSGVTMALSGLGGDELFAGYDIFPRSVNLLDKKWMFSFPIGIRKLLGGMIKVLKPSIASDKIAETLRLKYLELPYYYPINRQVLSDKIIAGLLGSENLGENQVHRIAKKEVGVDSLGFKAPFLSKVSNVEINTYMNSVLLRDTDQMSMAHALEVRVPFLDHELVEYVYGVPDEFKFPYSPKKLLVDSLGDLLPSEIVNRPKMGFVFPWEKWMKMELKSFCEENLKETVKRAGLKEGEVMRLWNSFLSGNKRVTWSRVWHLVVLGFWLKQNNISN